MRSPRRVKVLLNNFATNIRIAESRGIAWKGRAREVAKLTVLQTEFPQFATATQKEPRLPGMVISPPAEASAAMEELLERHGVAMPSLGADAPADTVTAEE